MDLLSPQLNEIIYATVAFLILLFLLSRFAFPAVIDIMDKRANTIKDSLEAAENTRVEAQKLLDDYKKEMIKARDEAQKIIKEGKKFGEGIKEEMNEKARKEADQMIERATGEIEREKSVAIEDIQKKVADLAVGAAAKVISKSLDKAEHEKIIDDFLSNVGNLNEN